MSLIKEKEEYQTVLDFMKRFFKPLDDTVIYFAEALQYFSQIPSEGIRLAYAIRSILRARDGELILKLLNEGTNRIIYDAEEAIELLEWIVDELLVYDTIETYEELQQIEGQMPALEFVFTNSEMKEYACRSLKKSIIEELSELKATIGSFFIRVKILLNANDSENAVWFDLDRITKGISPCLYCVIQPTKEEQKGKLLAYMRMKGFVEILDDDKEFLTYL